MSSSRNSSWERLWVLCLLAAACGCDHGGHAHLVTAEFQDETPDGVALQHETIRLSLDRSLPEDVQLSTVKVKFSPAVEKCQFEVHPGSTSRELVVKILTGTPAFRFQGSYPGDPEATGIGIDWDDGVVDWADLTLPISVPVLKRAIWEDRYPPPNGDLVVDQGDVIRLIFDRPVKLEAEPENRRVLVPQDMLLSKPNSDRLDDGEFHARFEPGSSNVEMLIMLGSRPVLKVSGVLPMDPRLIDRFRPAAPSGLALNGTLILPLKKITDARGGPGAVSMGEVDLEYPEGYSLAQSKVGQDFPPPGHRIFHSVTPIAGGRAIVAGGATPGSREPLDQVLVYNPILAESKPAQAFQLSEQRLPHRNQSHTATLLAGPDEVFGTFDDVVLIAGGFDGTRSLSDLSLLAPQDDGSVNVLPLKEGLLVARTEHAAVAVGPNELLVDGGRKSDPDEPGGLVECAELIVITYGEELKPRIAHHQSFRTLARSFHTLTLLEPAETGDTYVLSVGGFGRARQQLSKMPLLGKPAEGVNVFCSIDSAAVLASPILLNVSAPEKSFELPTDFLLPLVRWGHSTLPVEARDSGRGPPRSLKVLISGGAIRHPLKGFDGPRSLWEQKQRAVNLWDLQTPQEHEASSPILFYFDPALPQASRFELLGRPLLDPGQTPERVFFSAAAVPGIGIAIAGGELRDGQALTNVEIYLADENRQCELAAPMLSPRTRHQAYVLRRGTKASLVLIGGVPGTGAPSEFSAVEEIPIR